METSCCGGGGGGGSPSKSNIVTNEHPHDGEPRSSDDRSDLVITTGSNQASSSHQVLMNGEEPVTTQPLLSPRSYACFLAIIFVVNSLSNGVLPSLSSFTCLPFGETPYHLSQALGNMANPIACVVAMLLPTSSLLGIGFYFVLSLGGLFAVYAQEKVFCCAGF